MIPAIDAGPMGLAATAIALLAAGCGTVGTVPPTAEAPAHVWTWIERLE
ncbi:MAG TPA: hypothetical protein VIE36_16395 [Methylomirabilota bacterium]|jgi:hypothetical protein